MRRRLGNLLAVAVSLAAMTACSDDPEATADPPASNDASSGSATPTDPSSPPTRSDDPSEPTVPSATGDLMQLPTLSMRAPDGFEADPPGSPDQTFAFERGGTDSITLSAFPAITQDIALPRQAELALESYPSGNRVRVLDPVEVGGIEMYHVDGPVDSEHQVEYGAIHDGMAISIRFTLSGDLTPARREALVDSVIATFATE